MTTHASAGASAAHVIDSQYAWTRLGVALALGTVGSVGMWSAVVALPAVQADFGIARGDASLPFTLTMIGFGAGGIVMGRLADRFGVVRPLLIGVIALVAGYLLSAFATNIWQFALAQGLLGFGASGSFGPIMTDISHWFEKRRGIAVALASCGNYLAGAIWPPLIQYFISTQGWRATQVGIGLICAVAMLPLILAMRRPAPAHAMRIAGTVSSGTRGTLGLSSNTLMGLLIIAGVACCVAMSMPQVHIVAYCGDLGYGPARGAEMLSAMLGFGLISRVACGFIADRIGGVATLLISSVLQGVALFLYLLFDGLILALRDLGAVRPVPGRHRPDVRHHRARIFRAERSRHPAWHRADGHSVRHGARRMDVRRNLRSHRLLHGGVSQRARLESHQRRHRGMAADAAR